MAAKASQTASPAVAPSAPPRKKRWWLWGCLGCLGLVLIIGVVIAVLVGLGIFWSAQIPDAGDTAPLIQKPETPPPLTSEPEPENEEEADGEKSDREIVAKRKYRIQGNHSVTNLGPEVASPVKMSMALFRDVDDYQKVLSEEISPQNYTTEEDQVGNRFIHYTFESLAPGESLEFVTQHTLEVAIFCDRFGKCLGQSITSFMLAEQFIESDAPEIQNKASEITQGAQNICEKAFKIYNYLVDNLTYLYHNDQSEYGALQTLLSSEGDCTEFSDLYVALARAAAVPARFVEGVVFNPEATEAYDQQHAWSEVNFPGAGWSPVDVTWGQNPQLRPKEFAGSDGDHFLLTRGRYLDALEGMHFLAVRWWWYGEDTELELKERWDQELLE